MGCCGGGHNISHRDSGMHQSTDPLDILKARLLAGEITVEEYESICRALNLEEHNVHHAHHALKAE